MATNLFDSDSDESEFEGFRLEGSDSESDVSVSSVNTEDLSDLSDTESEGEDEGIVWKNSTTPVVVPPFCSPTGPTTILPEEAKAVAFFSLYFDDEVKQNIVLETNRYARQCIARKPDPKWYDMTVEELTAYIGIHVYMGIHKLPETQLYWSSDEALGVLAIKKVMTRDRFNKLSQYMHLNNNENAIPRGQQNHDKLFKVRPLLDSICQKFQEQYMPKQNLAVDEAMVAYKGQLSMKQYMPMKPIKRGLKVWACADSMSGYVCNFQVYTGKKDGGVTEHGLGYRVVREMTQPYINKHHHVFCDNFFTSVKLAQDLEKDNTYICGTVRSDRKDLPSDLGKKKPEVKALQKGESLARQCKNLVCSVWKDTKTVYFLSTQSSPVGTDTVNRKQKDGSVKAIPTVPSSISYNQNMGGVDKSDQLRGYYAIGRKSRKWWRYLMWFVLDVSIVNAHILECESTNHRRRTHLNFRVDLAKGLVKGFSSRSLSVGQGTTVSGHWPTKSTKGRCKLCLKKKKTVFCRMACMACNERICLDCFANHA